MFSGSLISNTLPQLEQSSLHPTTVPRHRLLLQTTLQPSPSSPAPPHKEKQNQQQGGGGRSQKGLRPFQPTTEIKCFPVGNVVYPKEGFQIPCNVYLTTLFALTM